ncbi:MAG: hypothetical protein KC621_03660, partial [Myxococcales bacterium]|nr:hypothetical protein [Myxococcales bacterium]
TALVGAAEGVPDDHAPLAAALAALAGGRVALVWVPNLARDPDFAAWIVRMTRQGSHPMLVVTSAPTDEPADVALLTDAGARLIDVPPLGRGEVSELLRRRFGLASDVAAVAERIGGGAPRVAIEVVEKWFRDDLLVHERGAWRVADGRTLSVSAPSVSLHAELLQTVCAPLRDADRRVVVAASLLGPEVSDLELAASSPGRDVASVLARLHAADQLARHDEGWTWKSEPARAAARSLVDVATLLEVAAACADAVDAEADPGRAGRLHLEAGACATAAPLLLDGAEKAIDARRLQHGAALLDTWESLRREPGVDGDGETLVRARSLRAVALWERGFTVESGAVREEVVRIARPLGGDALAGALLAKGQLHGASGGSVQETLELLDEALSLVTDPALRRTILHGRVFTRANAGQLEGALADAVEASGIAGQDAERAGSFARMGRLQAMLGRLDEASDTFARALTLQDPTDVIDRIRMLQDMAHVHDRRGQDAVALEMMEEALVGARRYAALSDVADLLSNRAEIIRRAGRLDEAEAGYREAMLCLRRLGVQPDAVLVANLALVHLERGEWSRGRELMDRALARVKAEGRPGWTGVLAGLALPAYADDPEALVEALELRASALDQTHHSDRDVYRMMRVAARRLDDLGPPDLARRVREAALAEAEALGMPDLVAEARTALAR